MTCATRYRRRRRRNERKKQGFHRTPRNFAYPLPGHTRYSANTDVVCPVPQVETMMRDVVIRVANRWQRVRWGYKSHYETRSSGKMLGQPVRKNSPRQARVLRRLI